MNPALSQEFHFLFANRNSSENIQFLDKKSYYVYGTLRPTLMVTKNLYENVKIQLWNLGFVEAYENSILRGQGLST